MRENEANRRAIIQPSAPREGPTPVEWCSSFLHECPCGYFGDPVRQCTCPPSLVSRYQRRISGPFIDRVDIFVEVPRIEYEKLADDRLGEPSAKVQARVSAARTIQLKRFEGSRLTCNAEMTPTEIRQFCRLEDSAQAFSRRP